jgi:hypothetical protein
VGTSCNHKLGVPKMCLFSTYITNGVWCGSHQNVKVRLAGYNKIRSVHNAHVTHEIGREMAVLTPTPFKLHVLIREENVNVTNGSDVLHLRGYRVLQAYMKVQKLLLKQQFNCQYVKSLCRIWAGCPGFESRQEQEIFLYRTTFRPALGPTQPHIQWLLRTISPGVKLLGRETDHSPPPIDEVTNDRAINPLPYTFSWRGA